LDSLNLCSVSFFRLKDFLSDVKRGRCALGNGKRNSEGDAKAQEESGRQEEIGHGFLEDAFPQFAH